MKTIKPYIWFLSIITTFIVIISCQNDLSTSRDFLIKVDSIHFPDSVASNTPFNIEFFGTIGFNGCTKFKSFLPVYKDNKYTIGAWGTYDDKSGQCPDMLVLLDGKKLNLTVPSPGIYLIVIQEPDNSSLVVQIIANQK